jgi:hypothetical protein
MILLQDEDPIMRFVLNLSAFAFLMLLAPVAALAEDIMVENFEFQPEARWSFFTDRVMGGVSTGQATFVSENGDLYAHMTGKVSTENNGGFIQIRMELPNAAPEGSSGVRLLVRGNDQRYFVHLRTRGTMLPWQYYQAGFEVAQDWTEVRLPFTAFEPSGRLLRNVPRASSLKSIGIVAFGREHDAQIDIKEVGFF